MKRSLSKLAIEGQLKVRRFIKVYFLSDNNTKILSDIYITKHSTIQILVRVKTRQKPDFFLRV